MLKLVRKKIHPWGGTKEKKKHPKWGGGKISPREELEGRWGVKGKI